MQELINAGCLIDVPIADICLTESDLWQSLYDWCALAPLTLAIALGQEAAATLLAQHVVYRPDIYKRDRDINKGIYPPLHIAAAARMSGVVRNLLSNGHDPGDSIYYPPATLPLEPIALTPLHYAATSEDNAETINVLLRHGASLNTHIRSQFRRPPQLAIYGGCPRNALHLISHHLASGDNSRWPQSGLRRTADNDGMLAVTEALVKVLNARGDFKGIEAAFLTSCKGMSRSSKTKMFLARFLASELNQGYLGGGGRGYFHWICQRPKVDLEFVSFILENKHDAFDINAKDDNGNTALDYAERRGHDDVAYLLRELHFARRGDEV
ncbi:ankyrin repeat-containing domain protein [Daldinia caldariorum]|uniref:ankyrin repeat-containing domain protein n=1 Tax=Daldinia caldariorum TaxID=326644 RepID=UPI0020074020|nr:ankyrin repeat-containing domain protein [Daldinia caldariorum]KAI1468306.1 ankyrin repeat-containing domain protein [Daldinia caldariorum]